LNSFYQSNCFVNNKYLNIQINNFSSSFAAKRYLKDNRFFVFYIVVAPAVVDPTIIVATAIVVVIVVVVVVATTAVVVVVATTAVVNATIVSVDGKTAVFYDRS